MLKIAIVGVTGLVGSVMLKVLEERNFKNIELIAVASSKSVGKEIVFFGKKIKIQSVEDALKLNPDIAIFSAGSDASLSYAPKFAEKSCYVIDNSSAWRMNRKVPLVVPEINANEITSKTKIIANPNCSTIQMVVALAPLHNKYKLKRLVISTYQSVTGTGVKAVKQLQDEENNLVGEKAYPYPIHRNLFPHGGSFLESGYTSEEEKLVNETRKILSDYNISISATVVRVPVTGGHSMAVNAEFISNYKLDAIRKIYNETPGIILYDDVNNNIYPMPLISEGKDEVFVGRLRRDNGNENTLNMWISADNLRKGAATNAIQIAEYLISRNLVKG